MTSARTSPREHYPVFDVLRIVAALAVILSHSYPLSGHVEPFTIRAGDTFFEMGTDAVIAFFVMSGFLITMSWERDSVVRSYLAKRFARIWPGFVVVVSLGVFVLGPLATTLSTKDYLTDKQTWSYFFHTIVMVPVMHTLPGVFVSNPLHSVNGSLWTLPNEVLCYLVVMGLGLFGLLRHRAFVVGCAIAVAVLYRLSVASHTVSLSWAHLGGINARSFLPLLTAFLLGSCLYLFRERVPYTPIVAAVATVVLVVGAVVGEALVLMAAFSYLVIYVGTRPWHAADRVRKHGDPSYGIYLYAWPMQQIIVAAGVTTPLVVFGIAAPAAIVLGYASWFLVEKRAMRVFRRRSRQPRPAVGDAAS